MAKIPNEVYAKMTVEQRLNMVNYDFAGYIPSDEALFFVNFIKEVNDGEEENETPVVHLVMMDDVFNGKHKCAVLCHRGIGKTTLFAEYLILFIAAFGRFPGFGKVNLMLYITDSIENGVKNLRRNVEFRYSNSDFLKKLIPNKKIKVGNYDTSQWVDMSEFDEHSSSNGGGIKFTDIRLEFENNKGHKLVVKGYGARALSLDTRLYKKDGYTTIGECFVGEEIYGSDGKLTRIIDKSEIFIGRKVYDIYLADKRRFRVCEEHLNPVYVYHDRVVDKIRHRGYEYSVLTTKQLKSMKLKSGTMSLIKTKIPEPIEYENRKFPVDPYTLGVLLGDGNMPKGKSVRIRGLPCDVEYYSSQIQYEHRIVDVEKQGSKTLKEITIYNIINDIENIGIRGKLGDNKFIPSQYMFGSVEQRRNLLAGLLDTDGSISDDGRISFTNISKELIDSTVELARGLGYYVSYSVPRKSNNNRKPLYRIYIRGNVCPFKLPRKANLFKTQERYSGMVPIVDIVEVDTEPMQCISVDNASHEFIIESAISTHNTGVRGAKEMGQRPSVALMDDLLSDEDSRSPTIISSIEDTIYKAVSKALHPTRQKMVWLGTPFNQKDPLYKAVESGAWNVSCYPVCEWFDENTTKETFKGSWADRFPYEYVKREFEEAKALGRLHDFYQELMLRIMSEDERLVLDSDITWYSRADVLKNKDRYNWYITTDFATSEKTSADYSVISVWAYNNNADWLWVDGIVKRQLMDKNVNDLFKFVQKYKPMSVGIEISGQQSGFVAWVKNEMINKNIFFNLERNEGATKDGLMPNTNKLMRFNTVVPLFKAGKIWLPTELKDDETMKEAMNEIRGASMSGFKSKHDDWLDTVSMLSLMNAFRPSVEVEYSSRKDDDGIYIDIEPDEENSWTGKSTIF